MESLICVSARLRDTSKNVDACSELSRIYKPVQVSKNDEKKKKMESAIYEVVKPLYDRYRKDILDRDFSFLEKDSIVVNGVDIGLLYINTLSEGIDSRIRDVTSELLYFFFHVMDDEDKSNIRSRYKKKKAKKAKDNTNIVEGMQDIMSKHKDVLVKGEGDPNATMEVLTSIFKDNSADVAKMATSILENIGISPQTLNKMEKKKSKSTK